MDAAFALEVLDKAPYVTVSMNVLKISSLTIFLHYFLSF